MKRLYICLLTVLVAIAFGTIKATAQDYSSVNLHFVYIAHDVTTPITELCQKLRTLHEDAEEVDDALIIYLSDGKYSLLSFTNLKDKYNKDRDKEKAFTEVIAALQDANSHDVVAEEDIKNIIALFDEYNFVDETGKVIFNNVTFDFYVGTGFWSLNNNEKVIAHLYQDFGMGSLPKASFTLNVYVPKADASHIKAPLFGDNNVEGINGKVKVLTY